MHMLYMHSNNILFIKSFEELFFVFSSPTMPFLSVSIELAIWGCGFFFVVIVILLPARASEQGNVIRSVRIYIYMCVCTKKNCN